jgi:hypothetical protein
MRQHQTPCPQPQEPTACATCKQAQENRAFVRALLVKKQPEFARLLRVVERELTCPNEANQIIGNEGTIA